MPHWRGGRRRTGHGCDEPGRTESHPRLIEIAHCKGTYRYVCTRRDPHPPVLSQHINRREPGHDLGPGGSITKKTRLAKESIRSPSPAGSFNVLRSELE